MIDLDAIEKRCNAVTPGPWEIDGRPAVIGELDDDMIADCCVELEPNQVRGQGCADAIFIVHIRADALALCAKVRRLRAELAEVVEDALGLCDAAKDSPQTYRKVQNND